MPTYQYTCTDCGEQVEAVQKFSDDPLTVCPHCGGTLRKVFSPVGIVFKGSGFYRNDSRKGSSGDRPKKDKDKEPAGTGPRGPTRAVVGRQFLFGLVRVLVVGVVRFRGQLVRQQEGDQELHVGGGCLVLVLSPAGRAAPRWLT